MVLFSGDVIKFISYNVHSNKNVIFYGVCLERVDLSNGEKIKYMNLYNSCISRENVKDLVSISLVGNIRTIYGRMNGYIAGLSDNTREALMREMKFLVSEKNRGKFYTFTKNNALTEIAGFVGCDVLVCSCLYLGKSLVTSLSNKGNKYNNMLDDVEMEDNNSHNIYNSRPNVGKLCPVSYVDFANNTEESNGSNYDMVDMDGSAS